MQADQLAALPVPVETVTTERHERDTSSGFTRVTTEFVLSGDGETGRGEDVTYEAAAHDELAAEGLPDLTGEYTFAEFSATVEEASLFPTPPERPVSRNYRQWGLEAAALDLGLRVADTDFASLVGHTYEPVRFVASTRLGDPPTTDRLDALRRRVPDIEFKLDPTPGWGERLIKTLGETRGIRVLDLKGHYEGTDVDVPADRALYERILNAFPNSIIEDPALTEETRPLFEADHVRNRVSWDEPIESLADVKTLPWEPSWLNIKPSRFGSLQSVLETLAYCGEQGIRCYGGGQFELSVGRGQIQALASLFYPENPNDVAPGAYNDPEPGETLPASPLDPPSEPTGFRWE
ncbi:hypothetical protein EGH24_09195 [Halonotius terrestris]|uniref:L-alanine-DL-glutamate epimerase n=1 Tax=Halonotius terrestris TaxID=2487750 RepID=A0A8J8P929_9EURY|nr:hypothetical protein [Halonotius terrestris]TQQ81289.1 hypothetical protein EGH24_09195 [Halonotius terrestris]